MGGRRSECLVVSERLWNRENGKDDADVGVCHEKQHTSDDEDRKDTFKVLA